MVRACNSTLKALKEIVDTVTELNIFNTANLQEHRAVKALAIAQHYIKACFNTFGVSSISSARGTTFSSLPAAQLDDWSGKEQLILDAVEKDKERIGEVNKALAAVSRAAAYLRSRGVSHDIHPATSRYGPEQGRTGQSICLRD